MLVLLALACGAKMTTLPDWDPSLAAPAPGLRELPLPAPERPHSPGPHPVHRLAASHDGQQLMVAREGVGEPLGIELLDLERGLLRWSHRTPCCAGTHPAWALRPAPSGGAALLIHLDSEPPVRLLTESGRVVDLPGADLDTRWSADGGWVGGSGGAWDANGRRLGPAPLPRPAEAVLPGANPGALRLVSEGVVRSWTGGAAAPSVGLWLAEPGPGEWRLLSDGHDPAWPSPGGTHLIARDRGGAYALLTPEGGATQALPSPLRAAAWLDDDEAVLLIGEPWGEQAPHLLLLDATSGQTAPLPVELPGEPSALAGAPGPRALFIGTQEGRVFRVDGL